MKSGKLLASPLGIDPSQWRRRIDRLLDERTSGEAGEAFAAINLWANEKEAILTAEIPGVDPESISVKVHGRVFSMEGERVREHAPERLDAECIRKEREHVPFSREVELPFEIESEHVRADYHHGVMTVMMPMREEVRARQVEVERL